MPKTATEPRYATLARAAEYADVTPLTIRRFISAGKLTGYRLGNKMIRVDLNELDALMRPIKVA